MVVEPQARTETPGAEEESSFYQDLASAQMSAYWQTIPSLPKQERWAHVWKWRDVEPLVMRAGKVMDTTRAERRVLLLSHPRNPAATTDTLTASIQLVLPGEVAPAHRHTMTAIRFIIQGHGAFTDVEGERCYMEPNDLVLTPSWFWHSHANVADEPVIWLDGLDSPIVRAFRADLFEPGGVEAERIANTRPPGYTRRLVGNGLVRPSTTHLAGGQVATTYRWSEVYPELLGHTDDEGSPYEGVLLDYVNQAGAPSTLPTMHCRVQLLRPSETTSSYRHMGSVIYRVVEGRGRTTVDDTVMEWEQGDVFSIPSWSWRHHENLERQNAVLFSYTDAPAVKALGLYREEVR